MSINEEIFKKLDEWVFSVETQEGDKLHVIDAIDLKEIIPEIMEVVKKFNYTPCCMGEAEQLACDCDRQPLRYNELGTCKYCGKKKLSEG